MWGIPRRLPLFNFNLKQIFDVPSIAMWSRAEHTENQPPAKFKSSSGRLKRLIRVGYLEDIKNRGRDANPFFGLMGIDVVSFGDGKAVLSMEVRPDMLNGVGWLQGGLYVALCDEAMALALYTILKEGELIATISESTSYLRGIRKGWIHADAKVVKKGGQVAFTDGCVTDAKGGLLSESRASFTIFKR
jgi:acyl-CoA thioesterase